MIKYYMSQHRTILAVDWEKLPVFYTQWLRAFYTEISREEFDMYKMAGYREENGESFYYDYR